MSDPKSGAETMQLLDTFVELFKERILASREDVSLLMTSSTGDDYDAIALTATTIKDVPKAEKKSARFEEWAVRGEAIAAADDALCAVAGNKRFIYGRNAVDIECHCMACLMRNVDTLLNAVARVYELKKHDDIACTSANPVLAGPHRTHNYVLPLPQ